MNDLTKHVQMLENNFKITESSESSLYDKYADSVSRAIHCIQKQTIACTRVKQGERQQFILAANYWKKEDTKMFGWNHRDIFILKESAEKQLNAKEPKLNYDDLLFIKPVTPIEKYRVSTTHTQRCNYSAT